MTRNEWLNWYPQEGELVWVERYKPEVKAEIGEFAIYLKETTKRHLVFLQKEMKEEEVSIMAIYPSDWNGWKSNV